MKKLYLAVVSLLLISAPVLAAEKLSEGTWYMGFGGGIDIPTQNWSSAYSVGGGGTVRAGYNFDKNLALQFEVENMVFDGSVAGTSTSVYNPCPFLAGKLTADIKTVQPYVFLGPALDVAINSANGTSTTDTNFSAKGGLGIQLDLGSQTNLYVEGKYHMVFLSNSAYSTSQDLPVEAGMTFGL